GYGRALLEQLQRQQVCADVIPDALDGALGGRVLEDGQQQHPRHRRDERGGEPARQHAEGGQYPRPHGIRGGVEPGDDLGKKVRHSMYPRPRSWSATWVSTSSVFIFFSSFSMQWATNSSTLL